MFKHAVFTSLSAAFAAVCAVPAVAGQPTEQVTVNPNRIPSAGDVPDRHVVQSGDTLFDLSLLYFGDAYQWPKLWSFNPQVSNPHWIYPGDILFLRPEVPARIITEQQRAAADYASKAGYYFPLSGFWTGSELTSVGTLKYARTARAILQPLDEVYLEFSDPGSVLVGQEYAINRVVNRVTEDETEELVAVEYEVVGRVKVMAKSNDTALITGQVSQLWDAIYRGDALFVNEPQLLVVQPRANDIDAEAEIIGSTTARKTLHIQDYVFINLGWNDGVRPGNRLAIWDRQDEGTMFQAAVDERIDYQAVQDELPWQKYGEAMVIYATGTYATAVITTAANHEIETGLKVTFRKGD